MADVAIVCGECGKSAPRGSDDPRPHGGHPEGSIEAEGWKLLNRAAKPLCDACFKKVTAGE